MKRTVLMSSAIIITLLVAGVWAYLLFFGTPNNTGEVFTNLGFTSSAQPSTIITPENRSDSPSVSQLVDTGSQTLNQLTTRPVAGFTSYTSSSSESIVRYVERGTGHVFDLNLVSGQEERVSPTTIPQASEVIFGSNPNMFAVQQHQTYQSALLLAELSDGELEVTSVSNNADNVFLTNDTVYYTELRGGETVGIASNPTTETNREEFRFAFAELDVWWGSATTPTYIATKPASNLQSFVYEVTDTSYRRALPARTGLTGFSNGVHHIITYPSGGQLVSQTVTAADSQFFELPILALREKCVFDPLATSYLWCGAPFDLQAASRLDGWYKGTAQSDDAIWLVNLDSRSAELVANPADITGRPLDMLYPVVHTDNSNLLFLNRTDRTLWNYSVSD